MSFKRRLQSQYHGLVNTIYGFRLPRWLTCKATRVLLLVMIVGFGAGYLIKTASSASSGYQIQNLENQISDLQLEVKRLEVDIADHSSMASIQKRLSGVEMVALNELQYYSGNDKIMAKR